MNILALDFGSKRIGLAIFSVGIVMPYKIIENNSNEEVLKKIEKIIEEEDIFKIVVGFPYSNKNFVSDIMKKTEDFIKLLKNNFLNIIIEIEDEYLSSKKATWGYKIMGYKNSKIKKIKDMGAACKILESYLEKNRFE